MAGLSRPLQEALTEYEAAIAPPERKKRAAVALWHKELVDKLRQVLSLMGVAYEDFPLPDGTIALKITPVKGKSELNHFVADIGSRLGVTFIFSPRDLVRRKGHTAHAKFNPSHHLIFLSHDIVRGVSADDSLHHEVLHAVFERMRETGVDSLFFGTLTAEGEEPLWKPKRYERRMSMEELATQAVNMRVLSRELEAASSGEEALKLTRRLSQKSKTLLAISRGAARVLGDFLSEWDDEDVSFKLVRLPTGREIGVASVELGEVSYTAPLVSDEAVALVKRLEAATLDSTRRKEAARLQGQLASLVKARVKAQKRLALWLAESCERLRVRTKNFRIHLRNESASDEEKARVVELAGRIRKKTLRFISWPLPTKITLP